MAKFEEELLQAMEIIANNAVEKADYDKTIKAVVVSCVDQTIGKFKVKYQDSSFFAYATSADVTYSKGTEVYVLIPGNDNSREKTIIGTTKKLGVDYAIIPEGEEAFETIGNNCIQNLSSFKLCSYIDYTETIYNHNLTNNKINVNIKSVEEYIRESSKVILGGTFKTNLPLEQRFRGNYGIIFELAFLDNASEKLVNREYIIDVNQMIGNPYKLTKETRQYGIFDIDNANFQYINKISIFTKDFPNKSTNKPEDIFISNIEFIGANRLSENELSSCALTFITPQGIYFDSNDLNSATREIKAQVRVRGKIIDDNSQSLEYYWFAEDLGVTTMSEKYYKHGGQGWRCLNSYNLIKPAEDGEAPVVEWISGDSNKIVIKNENIAKENKYKCVVIYNDNTVLSKEISIFNHSSDYEISIASDEGKEFYYDIGNPTLTCKINGNEKTSSDFTYLWAEIDNNNNYYGLSEAIDENNEYNNAVSGYSNLQAEIEAETKLAAASQAQLDNYQKIIDKYKTIMRVEKNKIHKVDISKITNFSTYKCAVYYKGVYIGTSSIVLTNSLEKKDMYSLVINNGSQVFKYNEAGIAPNSEAIENPQELLPLSFTIYDNLGNPISEDIISKAQIKWIVPTKETMITIPTSYEPDEVDLINNTKIYNNLLGISYDINRKYNSKYSNNNIKLIVDYKGMNLVTTTDFTFAKEGEPGTNGTEFLCKIVPNIASGNIPKQVSILNGQLNYTPKQSSIWFKTQLWHNGEKIFDSVTSGTSSEGKNVIVAWEVLRNKYNANTYDNTNITINATTGACSYSDYVNDSSPANIIKCTLTYDGIEYYATLPIITAKSNSGYTIELKEDSGFKYGLYTADGRKPQYDNSSPFEIIITQIINNYKEDISTLTGNYAVTYNWYYRGKIYNPSTKLWDNKINLMDSKNYTGEVKRNQKWVKPIDTFDGECLNNGIECVIKRGTTELGRIHIPIHLLLNKYGNAAINSWDGNSVSIDKNGSGVILAPQVGAGQKESDNSFTGMLMGKVKESGKANAEVGLFGYNKGTRTLFLNSKDGSAILGKNGSGQIILDPNASKAMIYSSNYWKNYNEEGKPTNYNSTNENGQGLLIDLTTPQIKYGNGNFIVNSSGHLTAKGGGSIAGWTIGNDKLYKGKVGISSNNSADTNLAFWAGNATAASAPFSVSFGGHLKASTATIGSGTNKITIGKNTSDGTYSAIYSGSKSSLGASASGFYIGTNGMALGRSANGHSPFEVTSEGALFSKSGTIAGYTIKDNTLTGGSGSSAVGICSKSGVAHAFWAGNETSSNAPFRVGHDGRLTATAAIIEGKITATSGTFGGWNINDTSLTGGNTYLNKDGAIGGTNWSITAGGYATFNNVFINNAGGSTNMDWGNFKVDTGGNLTATNANFTGAINAGSTITSSTIVGGKINITTANGGFLRAGFDTNHVNVSGINTGSYGIAMNGVNGISGCPGIGNSSGDLNISSGGNISISPSNSLFLGNTLGGIILTGEGNKSLEALLVKKSGNGAQLGNLWVGDHVINDSSGSQIDMLLNLDLWSATGRVVRANGTEISGTNSTLNIKQNVKEKDLSNISNIIRQIKLYDYNYIQEFYNGKQSYGYIIDYLEKIPGFSEYITFYEDNRNKKYPTKVVKNQEDWSKFLLGAVIELQKQIDEIKGE